MHTLWRSWWLLTWVWLRHWPPTWMVGRLWATTKLGSTRLIFLCRIQSNQLVATSHEVLKHSQPLPNVFANRSQPLHIAHQEFACLHWWKCPRDPKSEFDDFDLLFFFQILFTNLWLKAASQLPRHGPHDWFGPFSSTKQQLLPSPVERCGT